MNELIVIVCCFAFSAAIIYITINRIYDEILPEQSEPDRSYAPEYRILTDNLDMLHYVRKHFEPGEYSLCLKSRRELLNECRKESQSIAILEPVKDHANKNRMSISGR